MIGGLTRAQDQVAAADVVEAVRPASSPRSFYPLAQLGRQANAVVALPLGEGNDPPALAVALKKLRKVMGDTGLHALIQKKDSKLYAYTRPGQRRRLKQMAARRKAAKRARSKEAYELRRESYKSPTTLSPLRRLRKERGGPGRSCAVASPS